MAASPASVRHVVLELLDSQESELAHLLADFQWADSFESLVEERQDTEGIGPDGGGLQCPWQCKCSHQTYVVQ